MELSGRQFLFQLSFCADEPQTLTGVTPLSQCQGLTPWGTGYSMPTKGSHFITDHKAKASKSLVDCSVKVGEGLMAPREVASLLPFFYFVFNFFLTFLLQVMSSIQSSSLCNKTKRSLAGWWWHKYLILALGRQR